MFFDTSILKMIWGGRKQSLEGKINPGYKSAELHLEDKNGIHNPAKQHCWRPKLSTELDEICEREHECTCLAVSIIFQLEIPNLQEIINSWLLGIVPTIYRTFVHTLAHIHKSRCIPFTDFHSGFFSSTWLHLKQDWYIWIIIQLAQDMTQMIVRFKRILMAILQTINKIQNKERLQITHQINDFIRIV